MQKQRGLNDFHSNHLIFPSYLHSIISGGSPLRTLLGKKKLASVCMTKEFYQTVTINGVNLFLLKYQLDKISLEVFHMTQVILPSYLFGSFFLYNSPSELFHSLTFPEEEYSDRIIGCDSKPLWTLDPANPIYGITMHTHVWVHKCINTLTDLQYTPYLFNLMLKMRFVRAFEYPIQLLRLYGNRRKQRISRTRFPKVPLEYI